MFKNAPEEPSFGLRCPEDNYDPDYDFEGDMDKRLKAMEFNAKVEAKLKTA
jgi:hypothetical protein